MLYNPFNALSLLDFSENPPRAFFVAVAYGPRPTHSLHPFSALLLHQKWFPLRHGRKKRPSENEGGEEASLSLASGVGNYVADVN